MKIYIRAAEEKVLEFVIDFCYIFNDGIKAAFNPDLTDSELDEVIEEAAEESYYSFMKTVAYNLKEIGLEILEGPTFSNQKDSKSCYFVLCDKDDYDKLKVKIILNLRISDHRLTKHKGKNKKFNRFEARDAYYERELENYRELNDFEPHKMRSNFVEIFISGHKFKTYMQALEYIINKVEDEMDK